MEMINVMDVNLMLMIIGAALAFGWGFVYFSERVAGTAFMEINGTKTDAPMMVPMALEALYLLLLSWLVAVFYMLQMDHGMVRGIGAIFLGYGDYRLFFICRLVTKADESGRIE
ncbi:MAG: hypothetical protein ACPGJJ_01700 [Parvibaculales bacterium]